MSKYFKTYEWQGAIYVQIGLVHVWNSLSDPNDWGRDPPRFHSEFRQWCVVHKMRDQLDRAEQTGNCEFIFTDRDKFMLFKLTWFE